MDSNYRLPVLCGHPKKRGSGSGSFHETIVFITFGEIVFRQTIVFITFGEIVFRQTIVFITFGEVVFHQTIVFITFGEIMSHQMGAARKAKHDV